MKRSRDELESGVADLANERVFWFPKKSDSFKTSIKPKSNTTAVCRHNKYEH